MTCNLNLKLTRAAQAVTQAGTGTSSSPSSYSHCQYQLAASRLTGTLPVVTPLSLGLTRSGDSNSESPGSEDCAGGGTDTVPASPVPPGP